MKHMHIFMQNGFTLLELFLVAGIIVIIASLTIPIGVNFYKTQLLDEVSADVLSVLRRAHAQATYQKNDDAYGVKFLADKYVLFQGHSYASRVMTEDEEFFVQSGVSFDGVEEAVFSKYTGYASSSGTVAIFSGGENRSLYISAVGRIEWQ